MAKTINWPGESGKTYKYYIYETGHALAAKGGNYVFAKETSPGKWKPVYIGETGDLSTRFGAHHKMDCIKRNGGTHIHAHLNESAKPRLDEETDLVRKWNPPCND